MNVVGNFNMTIEIDKIYRVVCNDNYQQTNSETCWTKDKKSCEEYIANSPYKHCLSIESATLGSKALKVNLKY